MRLIHCSDLHLDAPLITRHSDAAAAARRGELLHTLQRLFDGAALVKTSHGTNGFPPADRWDAFRLLADFCFTVTRRYGAPPEAS